MCKYCDSDNHFSIDCLDKPRGPLKSTKQVRYRLGKNAAKDIEFKNQWIQDNPPPWICYLQIHPWCPYKLDVYNMTLEHVEPKSKAPGKRHSKKNIRPACEFCNNLKGSRSLEQIIINYPHVEQMLDFRE